MGEAISCLMEQLVKRGDCFVGSVMLAHRIHSSQRHGIELNYAQAKNKS